MKKALLTLVMMLFSAGTMKALGQEKTRQIVTPKTNIGEIEAIANISNDGKYRRIETHGVVIESVGAVSRG